MNSVDMWIAVSKLNEGKILTYQQCFNDHQKGLVITRKFQKENDKIQVTATSNIGKWKTKYYQNIREWLDSVEPHNLQEVNDVA